MNIGELTQFHENPTAIAWWQMRWGKVLTWLNPSRRRMILAIGAIYVGVRKPIREMAKADQLPVPSDWFGLALLIFALFGILWLVYRAAANFKSLPKIIRKHPQIALHLAYWAVLFVLWFSVPDSGTWRQVLLGIAIIFPLLIWRCGYLLLAGQNNRIGGTRFADQLIVLWPAFGGTSTPYGKGLHYLSTLEAKNEEQLARSQLAGIKLFILAGIWHITSIATETFLYGPQAPVPPLSALVAQGAHAPASQAWAGIYCELIWKVLRLAVKGHIIIGTLRLFGFNVFRNTYKPLLAESVLEFWNRYYYYFKELLVTFFSCQHLPDLAACFDGGRNCACWRR